MALQQRSSLTIGRSRAAFGSTCFRVAPVRPQRAVRVKSWGNDYDEESEEQGMIREWPNKEFIAETLAAFPDAGVANVEEARCLYSNGGYTYLDVRSALEVEEVGRVKDAVNIPYVICMRKYDPETREKKLVKQDNPDFLKQVEKRFPNKETAKLLVACANGTQYSIDVLEQLDEAGYVNIVGLKGGYYNWFRVWDNKLNRRRYGEYSEQYGHDGDSAGIHSSGAGFEKMDPQERYRPPVY